jgi:hypothetical protein
MATSNPEMWPTPFTEDDSPFAELPVEKTRRERRAIERVQAKRRHIVRFFVALGGIATFIMIYVAIGLVWGVDAFFKAFMGSIWIAMGSMVIGMLGWLLWDIVEPPK